MEQRQDAMKEHDIPVERCIALDELNFTIGPRRSESLISAEGSSYRKLF